MSFRAVRFSSILRIFIIYFFRTFLVVCPYAGNVAICIRFSFIDFYKLKTANGSQTHHCKRIRGKEWMEKNQQIFVVEPFDLPEIQPRAKYHPSILNHIEVMHRVHSAVKYPVRIQINIAAWFLNGIFFTHNIVAPTFFSLTIFI